MSAAFELSEHELSKRFRHLAQGLNDELGFNNARLMFRSVPDRHGLHHWRLENPTLSDFELESFPGVAAKLADASNDACQLYFALAEQWVYSRRGYAFRSANLRFVISDTDPSGTPLQFRLEWAGRDPTDKFRFNGVGAAHPHWNFDTDRSWVAQSEVVDIDLEPVPTFVDLNLDDAEVELPPIPSGKRDGLDWFHKLHLPARATWNEALRQVHTEPEGQQHDPKSSDEVDNWIFSALRYLRHEFTLYAT